ncbi:prolipoprotein diacylglyceryl transferase [Eubacterium sp. MSJ-13]|uniref:prolipoprotein diacylglyceryl transferase n=1 Tax=Eubacterium sp. MSJ-13 TaxID=2841513 RepID=UPI001C10A5F4|nr:prolipoprotein diacylglyceryl transferase [Eubacterium sp. MSJ-13]MBU5478953.1 prolipoprotein diacylglyceryl transferase [Eubacterium sp. MSJ-13]
MGADIRFPHLGIEIEKLGKSISIGGFSIAYYGIIIAFGMVCGYLVAAWQAKRTGQDKELYLDLALWDIIFAVIGARVYYVIFSWDYYSKNLKEIINTRGGGLAIYGGVIAGVLTTFVFSKVRKVSFMKLLDTACGGLLVGQIIGRWGNFFNREAFGGYTNGLFAMQIKRTEVNPSNITHDIIKHIVDIDGVSYIQVHPTFLYESLWNIAVLLVILIFTKKKKYDGQLFLMYLLGYGIGRFWIEGLRTDQLLIPGTAVAVSQVLSATVAVISAVILVIMHRKRKITK